MPLEGGVVSLNSTEAGVNPVAISFPPVLGRGCDLPISVTLQCLAAYGNET